ncbi:MAG: CHAT domain-containing protein [Myxococcota bacterium]
MALQLRGLGRFDEAAAALTRAEAAIARSDGDDAVDVGRVLGERATLLRQTGHLDDAWAAATKGYGIAVAAAQPEARWPLELELGRIEAARGHLAQAIFFGKRAATTLDAIRVRLEASASSAPLAKAFVEDRIAAWRELGGWPGLGRAPARGDRRARPLEGRRGGHAGDARRQAPGRRAAAEAVDVGRRAEARAGATAEKPLCAIAAEARALAERQATDGLNKGESDRLKQLRDALRERRKAYEQWLESLEGELASMTPERAQAIAAMNLRDLAGMQGTLADLGHGAVVVHYLVTDTSLRAIVTTATGQIGHTLPIASKELNQLAFDFRAAVADPQSDPRVLGHELYDALIAPLEDDLRAAKAQTLMVSLDGALRYVPMAALWDGERWLVERYRIVHFTRAAVDKLMAPPKSGLGLAALGVARGIPGFAPLTEVAGECEGIVKRDDSDPDGVVPGVVRLDDAFSRESLAEILDTHRFSAVHIASHFVLEPGTEADSYLLLGDGQKLTLEDIRYELRFDGVDLLSLSACNTAVGDEPGADGRELEGFASLAMRLGARGVIATLWPVADKSTGAFMRDFYTIRQSGLAPSNLAAVGARPDLTAADALRQTMLRFIRGTDALAAADLAPSGPAAPPSVASARAIGPLDHAAAAALPAAPATPAPTDMAHPYYWAPFILVGGWL